MTANTDTLKKIRTFRSDMERLKPGPKSETPTVEPVPAHPTTPLPSVLNVKKPTPEIVAPSSTPFTDKPLEAELPTTTPKVIESKPVVPEEPINKPSAPVLLSVPKNSALSKEMTANLGTLSETTTYNPSDKLNVMDTDSEITEGTIITNKKRERFKLLPAMAEAVKSWFSEGRENIERRVEEKRLATPTVTTIEERKDVVKMAARQSAQAPKDDYKKLTDQLPKSLGEKSVPAKPSLVITKKAPEAKPSWSHYEGKEIKTVAPNEMVAPSEKGPEKPLVPPVIPSLIVKEEPTTKAEVSTTVPNVRVEPVELTIKDKPVPPTPRKWKETPQPKRFVKLSRFSFYAAAAVVALVAVVGGVMLTMWLLGSGNGLTPTTPTTSTGPVGVPEQMPLISADRETEILLPRSRTSFYEDILKSSQNSGGINVIIPKIDSLADGTPASISDILETLAWQASPALLRSISEMDFGTLGITPFIVMRVTSFDTALGGLLYAEDNLSKDLSPLFGEPVTSSFNVSKTSSEILPAYFEDDVVRNHDVRVLRDELEKERIVYGFVNQNTVIITTDRGTFATLAEAIR